MAYDSLRDMLLAGEPGQVITRDESTEEGVSWQTPVAGSTGEQGPVGPQGDAGQDGAPGTTSWAGITDKPANFTPSTHTHPQSDVTNLANDLAGKASTSHNHDSTYEAKNANIQAHIAAAHSPSNAQKNSDITKAEVEAVLTGQLSSHTHAVAPPTYALLANGATAMQLATTNTVKVTPTANATYTTTVPPAGTDGHIIILTSGTTSRTITFGTGFKPTATLATGTVSARVFVVGWISDGTNLYETSRTIAMVA